MRQLANKILYFAANKLFPALLLSSSLAASVAQAAPQGGVIVGGQGSINNTPNVTNINQQTNAMVVDWSSFNVGNQETVNFNQPSSNAAALNRIYDQNPSQILGSINANGRVFLSNPNGMIFGQSATVNVGALVATGLTISKDIFMNGNYHFNSDGYTPGAIINRGILSAASGGSVSLIGGQVVNEGYIVADYGRIDLATGKQAILNFDGDGLINIQVSEDILTNLNDDESSINNTGNLQANAGQIILDAHVAKDVFTHAINNEGVITAHRIENMGGEVYLSSNDSTLHSGEIDVYGEGETGGSVFLLGDEVTLAGNATVNASGQTAGGTILVGGDYQGEGDIQTAQFTTVEENVVLNANTENSGDGGKVIVWSDDTTVFHGQINARADGASGDGGFAEVSGKQHLLVSGHADLRSTSGQFGTLLLDPGTVDIVDGGNTPPASSDVINDGYIIDQLASSDMIISTAVDGLSGNEDLTVDAAADINWSTSGNLTLIGNDSVVIDGTITSTHASGGDVTLTGGQVSINNDISLNGGDFTSTGIAFNNNGFTVTSTAGDVDLSHSGNVTLGALVATAGDVTISSSGGRIDEGTDNTVQNIIAGGTVSLTASDRIGNNGGGSERLDINTAQLIIDAGNQVNIDVVSNDLSTAKDLSSLDLTVTSSYSTSSSDITAANLTFDVSESAGNVTITNVTDTSGLIFSLNNTDGNITVSDVAGVGGINVGSNAVNLTANGTITQSTNGIINATTLTTVTTTGNTTLNSDNTITGFNGTSTSGNISITDSTGNLDITGISTTTGDATITASAGAITQSSGDINTDRLTTTSTGANTTLETATNSINAYDGTTTGSGNISIKNTGDLSIRGIDSAGNATIETTGDLSQTGASSISAGTLTATSTTGLINLDNTSNAIARFNGTTSTAARNITISNGNALEITGITTSGAASVLIETTGDITQTGIITADLLTTDSTSGNTTLDLNNQVNSYQGITQSSGDILFINNSGALDIFEIDSAGNATITTNGAITQSGDINANLLTTSSDGNTTLNTPLILNTIGSFDATALSAGNVLLSNDGNLDIVSINTTGNADIATDGNLTQTGIINASTLTTTSTTGSTTLEENNTVSTYNGSATGNDNTLSFSNNAGVLNIGTISSQGDVTLTSNQLNIGAGASITATGKRVILKTLAGSNAIDLGSVTDGVASTLELSNDELNRITATNLTIGETGGGAIDITAGLSLANITNLHLVTSTTVSDGALGTLTGNKNIAIESTGAVTLDNAGHDINTIAIDAGSSDVTFVDSGSSPALTVGDVAGNAGTVSGITGNNVNLQATTNNLIISSDIVAGGTVNVTALATDAILQIVSGNTVTGTSGTHAYTADNMDIDGSIDAGVQQVTLKTSSVGDQINLGAADVLANATLELSSGDIDNITADTLIIGDSAAGAITISSDVTPALVNNLHLVTAGSVTGSLGGITGGKNLAIEAGGAVTINDLNTDVDMLAVNLTGEGDDFNFRDSNGFTVGTVDGVTGITTADSTTSGVSSGAVTLATINGTITISENVMTGNATVADIGSTTAQTGSILVTAGGSGNIYGTGMLITGDATVTAGNAGDIAQSGDITLSANRVSADGATTDHLNVQVGSTASGGADTAGKLAVTTDGTGSAGNILVTSVNDLTLAALDTIDAASGLGQQFVSVRVTGANNTLTVADASNIDKDSLFLRADRIDIQNTITGDNTNALLVLETSSADQAIGVGDGASGGFNLDSTELDNLIDFDHIVIRNGGGAGGTGVVDITGYDFDANSTNSIAISGGAMTVTGLANTGSITLSSTSTINDGATDQVVDITTNGRLTLNAQGLIGSAAADGELDTDIGSLDAETSAGGIYIRENNALTIDNSDVQTTGGNAPIDIKLAAGDLTLDGAITANGSGNINIELQGANARLDTGTVATNIISSTSGDITVTADRINVGVGSGGISSSGNLVLQPFTAGTSIGVGDAGVTGTFKLVDSELALLQTGFTSITIGSATSGNVNVLNATFNDDITLLGGDMVVEGLNASGNNATLNSTASIKGTTGGAVDITADNITLIAANGGVGEVANSIDVTAATTVNANTSADSSSIYISSTENLPLGVINSGSGDVVLGSDKVITDANGAANNVTANTLDMTAIEGIGVAGNAINSVVDNIVFSTTTLSGGAHISNAKATGVTVSASGDISGDIELTETLGNLSVASGTIKTIDAGDISLTSNAGSIAFGSGVVLESDGSVSLVANNSISGSGALTIDSNDSFSFNQDLNIAGTTSLKTATQMTISKNISISVGSLTLDSSAISFSPGVVLSSAGSLNILNADATASGDLTFNANGIDLTTALTVNNGDLLLNAGNDDLSISNTVTVNTGNLSITAADLEIDLAAGSIVGSDTVTISDSGNGMELGGTAIGSPKLNISLDEYELITAGSLVLATENTLTLNESFQVTTSVAPLTINANQFDVAPAGAVLGLLGNLDLADTAVVADADFTINVDGTFNMNNAITTNGAFTLTSGQGVTMGEPSSITSNNNVIDITTNAGDILLGLADAGTGNVNLTASAGSVLNNNGVFADVTQSKTNIKGTSTTITANERIGASSTDAITINTSANGLITLDFNAEKAFINNLQNTRIQNNGTGDVAVGLIFSGQIIGVGHNVGVYSQQTEEAPADKEGDKSLMSVLGTDHKLSAVDEEEEDSSTLNTVVPVMIRTKDGWEFKVPLRNPANPQGKERKVNWL